jgi:hypothetical protein
MSPVSESSTHLAKKICTSQSLPNQTSPWGDKEETDMSENAEADEMTVEQWLAIRKEAGLKIDPETAEVDWIYAQTFDPYGIDPNLPEEYWCIGRAYFARSPGSDIWVCFDDLPDATRHALWEKHKAKLAFPAGLEDIPF